MVKCAVQTCKNDSRKQNKKNSDVTYHRFPKCRKLAKDWAKAIKRNNWEPNIQSFVCSKHFSDSSVFKTKAGLRRLVENAIPELELGETKDIPIKSSSSSSQSEAEEKGKNVREHFRNTDTPRERKLRNEVKYLREIAKRRRLRCNALYVQNHRLKKKITSLAEMLRQVLEKQLASQENSEILDISGASESCEEESQSNG